MFRSKRDKTYKSIYRIAAITTVTALVIYEIHGHGDSSHDTERRASPRSSMSEIVDERFMCTLPTLSATTVAACESTPNGSIDLTVTGSDTYTFLWSPGGQTTEDISNVSDGRHTVTVFVNGDPDCKISGSYVVAENASPFANAGLDKDNCDDEDFVMTAVPPSLGTGEWSFIGPSNGVIITNPSSATTSVTGLSAGLTTTLRWTIININCTDFDDVILNNDVDITASAGGDQMQCDEEDFILNASAPTTGVGSWSIIGVPNGASITDPTSNTSTVLGLNPGSSITLRWTVTNGTCFAIDDITLTNNLPVASFAGFNQAQCNDGAFTMTGNNPFVGTGTWSIVGPINGASITTPSVYNTTVTGLVAGTSIIMRWTVMNGSCVAIDEVTLQNDMMIVSDAGIDQANCNSGSFSLAATAPTAGTGSWSVIGSPNGAIVDAPLSPTSTITGLLNNSSVTLRWTVNNGTCFSTDDILLSNDIEVFAIVGPDQVQCDNGSFVLQANAPVIGTGSWSILGSAKGAIITTPSDPNTTVTGLLGDSTVTLRWTIDNRGCVASDDVNLTNDAMVIADAGPDLEQCMDSDFMMSANAPNSMSGFWTIIGPPNGVSVANFTDPNTLITGLNIEQSATLRWTLTNGTCISTDDIVIINYASPFSSAGSNQEKCTTSDFTLAANDPVIGTGAWTFVGHSYDAVISDTTAHDADVSGLELDQTVTLRWTVSNGACVISEDVRLTNDPPVTSNAGADQGKCENDAFTLAAEEPTEGAGLWSIIGSANGTVIDNISSRTSEVIGLDNGTSVTLRWTVTNGGCTEFDEVILTNYADVVAAGGDDQAQCDNGSFSLAATPPTVGSGTWSIVGDNHGANITNPNSPSSPVNGLNTDRSVTLRWIVSNGNCVDSADVILTNNAPVVANAGSDQALCDTDSFTLSGNNPTAGSGQWLIIGPSNGATIVNDTLHNTSVSNLNAGSTITLRWSVTNGSCSEQDEVMLTNDTPTTAIAGDDQRQCNDGVFTLNGNDPTAGSGLWTIVGAAQGAGIASVTTYNTQVTGLTAGSSITLRWTVTNGTCTLSDDVVLTNGAPVSANAGPDDNQCSNGIFTLNANNPNVGTGTWTIIGAAQGGLLQDSSINGTTLTGLNPGQTITLRWTVSNGLCSEFDEVSLTNDAPVTANAGPDQRNCNDGAFTMDANVAAVGISIWSIVGASNGAVITEPGSATSTVTGLNPDQSVTLRWTITNGTCMVFDDVILTNDAPVLADAGMDQTKCNDGSFTMSANNPTIGVGSWSIIGNANGANINDPADPHTDITGLIADNSMTLRWTLTNGTCVSSDDVLLTHDILDAACPSDIIIDTCMTQAIIDDSFGLWVDGFVSNTNTTGTVKYDIDRDGIISYGLTDLSAILPPDSLGGYVSIRMEVTCSGSIDSCTARFGVSPPAALEVAAPPAIDKPGCSTTDDFMDWKDGFDANGGCNRKVLYDVIIMDGLPDPFIDTSNTPLTMNGATPTLMTTILTDLPNLSGIEPPSACGGSVIITIKASADSGMAADSSSTYSIAVVSPIVVFGPDNLETDTMVSQMIIDSLYAIWIDQFGFSGGTCGAVMETDLSTFSPPAFTSGGVTITYTVSDGCSTDTYIATFSVPPYDRVPASIAISGAGVVCGNNDGFTYRVDTLDGVFDIIWHYTGSGAILIEQTDNMVEYGFLSDATDGYLVASVSDGLTIRTDSIQITMAAPEICNIFCKGILDVSSFMIADQTMPDSLDYWAELLLTSDATILAHKDVTFNASLAVHLQPEFTVEIGGTLEIAIDHCDGLGFQDEAQYERVQQAISQRRN